MTVPVDVGLAANDLLVLGLGYAGLYGLGIARGMGALRLVGLAYLLGWAMLGIALSYAVMAGIGLDVANAVVFAILLALVSVVAGRFGPRVPRVLAPAAHSPAKRIVALAGGGAVAVACVCAAVVAVTSSWTPDYDTFAIWIPHAEVLYYRHGLWLGPDGWQAVYHPEYPPLVPAMDALTFGFVGGFHPSLLPIQRCLVGLSFIGAVLALLDRYVPRWLALSSVGLLAIAPEFFRRIDSILPDQTLAYLVATAALSCAVWVRERRTAWLVLSIILGVAATLTKLEGETYGLLLALIVCGGAFLLRKRRVALPALGLLLAPAAIEPWRLWLADHDLPTSTPDYRLSSLLHPLYAAHRVNRIPYALQHVLGVMFRPDQWLVVLPLVLIAVIAVALRSPLLAAASAVWLVLAFAGLIVVYWVGQFVQLTEREEITTSAYRVAGTIVIVAGTVLPLLLAVALEPPRHARPTRPRS